jgi:TPR repeat protein
MRSVFVIGVLVFCGACKKEPVAPAPTPQKCTESSLHVADPERCELSCFAGEVSACDVASSHFALGIQTRRDPGRALSIAAKGCDLGGAKSCSNVTLILSGQYDHEWPDGGIYENAEVKADYEKQAKKAATRECGAGRFTACALLSELEEDGAASAKKAVELMDKACTAKDGFACAQLARAYTVGSLGLARDGMKAKALNVAACGHGQPEACEPADNAARGCELGHGGSCFTWARAMGGPQAKDTLKRACDLRDGLACVMLARSEQGEAAQKLLVRACAVGHESVCPPGG